jgi:protein MpaA
MNPGWRSGFGGAVAAVAIGLLMLAVGLRRSSVPSAALAGRAESGTVVGELMTLGRSLAGRPVTAQRLGNGPRIVLMMASIHGSEPAGTPLLGELRRHLTEHPSLLDGVTLYLIPVANPDGLARGQRHNRRGVDLNRNFPAGNRIDRSRFGMEPLSEPESAALAGFIGRVEPSLIVSIHQPLACIDWDGPPETAVLAEVLARGSGLPMRRLGARPGSLGAWFGETVGRPILTMELPAQVPAHPVAAWERYGPGLLAVLAGDAPRKRE